MHRNRLRTKHRRNSADGITILDCLRAQIATAHISRYPWYTMTICAQSEWLDGEYSAVLGGIWGINGVSTALSTLSQCKQNPCQDYANEHRNPSNDTPGYGSCIRFMLLGW